MSILRGSLCIVALVASMWQWLQEHTTELHPDAYRSVPSAVRSWDIFRPAGFHHSEREAALAAGEPYFEGWYIKAVSDSGQVVAFIPGVFHALEPRNSHAFVIVFDSHGAASKTNFSLDEFTATDTGTDFDIQVGPNLFSLRGLEVDLPGVAQGKLRFSTVLPWPVTIASPGVMGPFAWAPWMECSHGVMSLSHRVSGRIQFSGKHGGRRFDFNQTDGYIEKDRGTHFPQTWVWLQSNSFASPNPQHHATQVSLSASIGRVPLPLVGRRLGIAFPGFIVGLMLNHTLYRFTTYTGAVTSSLTVSESVVRWTLEDSSHRLHIHARNAGKDDVALWGPKDGTSMEQYVAEGLRAELNLTLVTKSLPWSAEDGELLYHGRGDHGGIELMAQTHQLFSPSWVVPGCVVTPLHHPLAAVCLLLGLWLGWGLMRQGSHSGQKLKAH